MILEGRYYGAVEGLGDVVPDGVGVESIHQGLNSLVVLIALLHHQYVDIGGVAGLDGQSVCGGVQAGRPGRSWS